MSLSGNTEKITELLTKINALPEEPTPSYQEKTVTPSTSAQTVTPDSGYDALSKVTVNAMPTATQATPSITVSSGGLITAKATQTAGYVAEGEKSATKQLTVQGAQTITPGTADKTIASGRYLTGTQTIKGDSNLVAENIKSGVSIFGVAGSYEGSGGSSGGSQVAMGTFTVAAYIDTVDTEIATISGLAFAPKTVTVMPVTESNTTSNSVGASNKVLMACQLKDNITYTSYVSSGANGYSYVNVTKRTGFCCITPTSDGFILSKGSESPFAVSRLTYFYIAVS